MKRGAKAVKLSQELERERIRNQPELAKKHVLVNPHNLRPNNSYDTPEFVKRGHYVDLAFRCKSCEAPQTWTEAQQKWWYESVKGDVWAVAVLCRPCRRKERARRTGAREAHLSGLAAKRRNAP